MTPLESPTSALDCLREHLDAENQHDLARIMASYAPEPRVTINGVTFSGYEAVQKFHDRFGFGGSGAFSEVTVAERARHLSGLTVVLEQTLSGVHSSRWQGHEATGRKFEIPACTVYTFTPEGRLASEDVYCDALQMEQQFSV